MTLNLLITFRDLIVNDLEFQSQVIIVWIVLKSLRQRFSVASQFLKSYRLGMWSR